MKKVFLTLAVVVLAAVSANAQSFSKKDWFLGANVSSLNLQHSFVDDYSDTAFDIQAAGGYFLSDKFAIEGTLGMAYAKVKDMDSASAFTFGAGVRYYPVGNLFASAGYQGLSAKDSDLVSYLGVAVGYDLFLSEKVFFEPSINYLKDMADGGANTIGLSLGIGIKF